MRGFSERLRGRGVDAFPEAHEPDIEAATGRLQRGEVEAGRFLNG